ncbi:Sphingosine kinase 1 [Dissophora globulifera]|uniref:Sphingosine kinase 1 n=1 Tax=Dissophora globulifera TaxID=979702 RepID=A0A9P6R9X8_9FUNG|nr:Sphingosine kinase 1 [Dissophora globulifera]
MPKSAPAAKFECDTVFSDSPASCPTTLHLDAHHIRGAATKPRSRTRTTIHIPYCCIFGYETAEKARQNGNSDSRLDSCAIRLHYVKFTTKDMRAVTSPCMATVLFTFEEEDELDQFMDAAKRIGVLPKPRRILVLVNPNGGVGKAKSISDTVVKPMLQHSGLIVNEQYTEYGRHAVDIAHKVDVSNIDTLAVVSGDGVLHEVINGLLTRPDWDRARRLPIAIIPAGSGNAIATSTGPLRFDIAGFIRMIRLRRYPGKVYILPPEHKHSAKEVRKPDAPDLPEPRSEHSELIKSDHTVPTAPWRLLEMPFFSMLLLLNFPSAGQTIFFTNTIRFNDGIMRLFYSCETRFWRILLPFVMDQANGKLLERGLLQDLECGGVLIVPAVEGKPDDASTHEIKHPEMVTSDSARKLDVYRRPGVFDVDGEAMPTVRTLIEILPDFMEITVPEWFQQEQDESEEAEVAREKARLVVDNMVPPLSLVDRVSQSLVPLVVVAALLSALAFFSEGKYRTITWVTGWL